VLLLPRRLRMAEARPPALAAGLASPVMWWLGIPSRVAEESAKEER